MVQTLVILWNMSNALMYHHIPYKTFWYSWYHWKALDEYILKHAWPIFWAKFPHLVTKNKGTTTPTKVFLVQMALSHNVLRRKNVEFAEFLPNLLRCPQNITARFQNIVYCTLCPENLAKSLVEDPSPPSWQFFKKSTLLSTNIV